VFKGESDKVVAYTETDGSGKANLENRQIFASSQTILEHEKINSDSHAGHKDETGHAAKSECPAYIGTGAIAQHTGGSSLLENSSTRSHPLIPRRPEKAHIQKTVPLVCPHHKRR